jgi:hypothetical protein
MSATLEATTIDAVIDQATPEQRRYMVQKLLLKDLEESRLLPILLTGADGELLAYYVPRFRSKATDPPKLTPEEVAELNRRMATPNDVITHDELLKQLGLADAHPWTRR